MDKGQELALNSRLQTYELMELGQNIFKFQFLDITLSQFFMIFMIILSSFWSFLLEVEIEEILSPVWSVIFLIFNVLILIWYIYFAWLTLKFVLGWLVYFSS